MSFTLVDTDILIDAALQASDALATLTALEQSTGLAVSSITQMELLVGCRNKTELRKTEQFLRRLRSSGSTLTSATPLSPCFVSTGSATGYSSPMH